jgi:hypothetical protein
MKKCFSILLPIASAILVGCVATQTTPEPPQEYSIRPVYPGWANLHEGDPDLAGIAFMNDGGGDEYIGKHPAGVSYVFWDGRVRQTTHEPDGKVLENYWHRIAPWNRLDYSFGSDPKFERHEDPRKKSRKGSGGNP